MKPLTAAQWWEIFCLLVSVNHPRNPSIDIQALRARVEENHKLAVQREALNEKAK